MRLWPSTTLNPPILSDRQTLCRTHPRSKLAHTHSFATVNSQARVTVCWSGSPASSSSKAPKLHADEGGRSRIWSNMGAQAPESCARPGARHGLGVARSDTAGFGRIGSRPVRSAGAWTMSCGVRCRSSARAASGVWYGRPVMADPSADLLRRSRIQNKISVRTHAMPELTRGSYPTAKANIPTISFRAPLAPCGVLGSLLRQCVGESCPRQFLCLPHALMRGPHCACVCHLMRVYIDRHTWLHANGITSLDRTLHFLCVTSVA